MELNPEVAGLATTALGIAVRLVVIISIAYLATRLFQALVSASISRAFRVHREATREQQTKSQTLIAVATHSGQVVIGVVAVFMALRELAFDITPLIASAGIAGLALGLGAQTVIRDFLAGFLIILEDQYAVGDVIKVGEHSGTVERIDLRRTVIRNLEGSLINIPNSEVRIVANMTRGWSRVVLDVEVAYEDDPKKAQQALLQVADHLAKDPEYSLLIVEPPQVLGIESLSAGSLRLRLMVKTQPTKQWAVGRELRARVREAFRTQGINLAHPVQTVVLRDDRSSQAAGETEISSEDADAKGSDWKT